MAQSLHISFSGFSTNLPFGICVIYFHLKVSHLIYLIILYQKVICESNPVHPTSAAHEYEILMRLVHEMNQQTSVRQLSQFTTPLAPHEQYTNNIRTIYSNWLTQLYQDTLLKLTARPWNWAIPKGYSSSNLPFSGGVSGRVMPWSLQEPWKVDGTVVHTCWSIFGPFTNLPFGMKPSILTLRYRSLHMNPSTNMIPAASRSFLDFCLKDLWPRHNIEHEECLYEACSRLEAKTLLRDPILGIEKSETNSKSTWNWMVGIRSFSFGMALYLRAMLVTGRVNVCMEYPFFLILVWNYPKKPNHPRLIQNLFPSLSKQFSKGHNIPNPNFMHYHFCGSFLYKCTNPICMNFDPPKNWVALNDLGGIEWPGWHWMTPINRFSKCLPSLKLTVRTLN